MKLLKIQNSNYLYPSIASNDNQTRNLDLPLVVDTEFTNDSGRYGLCEGRLGLTIQIKGIDTEAQAKIYDHPHLLDYCAREGLEPKFEPTRHDFFPLTYLEDVTGIKVQCLNMGEGTDKPQYPSQEEKSNYPSLTVVLYAHFALAELFMLGNDDFNHNLRQDLFTKRGGCYEMTKRLRTATYTPDGQQVADSVWTQYWVKLDGEIYLLKIKIIDTCALHGVASYDDIAKNVGVELNFKSNYTQAEKENMLSNYFWILTRHQHFLLCLRSLPRHAMHRCR